MRTFLSAVVIGVLACGTAAVASERDRAAEAEAAQAAGKRLPPSGGIGIQEVGADASLCFTCGGAWPFFSGAIPLPAGSTPTERGGACSGGLRQIPDTAPFLCSK